jgi:ADP-ribosylglycohydrolase
LQHVPAERRDLWASRLTAAEASKPADFTNNGWVVEALQAAWSAIATTPIPQDDPLNGVFRVDHLRLALDAAVRGGNDTDTVAAIAGGLLGAAYGASAVPVGVVPRLVYPYRAGVKWDPADHLCVAGELLASEPVDRRWAIKGEIVELSC